MQRVARLLSAVVVLTIGVWSLPSPTEATTCVGCEVRGSGADCTLNPNDQVWSAAETPYIAARCWERYCAPLPEERGHRCEEYPRPARSDYFVLRTTDGEVVEGSFIAVEQDCAGESLFAFDSALLPGAYSLRSRAVGCWISMEPTVLAGLVTIPGSERAGDCDGDAVVSIAELTRVIAIALGYLTLPTCPIADASADGVVSISELVTAINDALR